jgi:hypothetical protein
MSDTDKVERYAESWVFPFLQSQLPDGYAVLPVPQNIQAQHRYGDKWLASQKHQEAIAVELKAEARHTGNLFIETWSDMRNGVHGWLYHYADCTRMAYAFNDTRKLYTCQLGELRKWAHSEGHVSAIRIEDFRQVEQSKYEQKNVTVGRLVPVDVFLSEVAGSRVHEVAEVTCGR